MGMGKAPGTCVLLAALALAGCKELDDSLAWVFGQKAPTSTEPPPTDDAARVDPVPDPASAPAQAPALALAPAPAPAEEAAAAATRPFDFEVSADPAPPPQPAACAFPELAAAGPFQLYAAGAYGGRTLGYQIDRSGNEGTAVDVLVNSPHSPVALMLGNYQPTAWNIGWTEGTRIVAVLVGGYHAQQVTGLPADVPRIVSTHDNRGACGYFYVSADKPQGLNPLARQVFGRRIDMLYPVREGKVVIGATPEAGAKLLTDAAASPVSTFRVPDMLAAGEAGLEYAVRQGWLRPATPGDAQAWIAALDAQPGGDLPPVAGGPPRRSLNVHHGYVVLKPFELPPGLYGAHSATFFVPKGVSRPTGNPGHSAIYDFNTLTCQGAICGMGQ
ncbi:MAG: hypothetical protein IAF01_12165 [Xanthomonadaceae bacterium]|nr:hypothetical protein [Xanthomonadaceae bacterium]